ncbi:rab gap:tbc [Echinococcus multilocularis]|uniref:Rab gap:tbc n=1 Tax=Echinococcus multilocularis TaxID=6211 RepID=A0A068YCB8_ECHMU|nr:rab gap:tbc [Echinococcus multilocularis]
MDSRNSLNLGGKNSSKKRRFTPNISKALAKISQSGGMDPPPKNRNSHDSAEKLNVKRPRINRQLLEGGESRYVQSYSIFETGLGCVSQSGKNTVELQSLPTRANRTSVQAVAQSPSSPMDVELDGCRRALVTDVQQFFRYPPICMPPDPPTAFNANNLASPSVPGTPKSLRSTVIPSQLFDETSLNGSLFYLRIPDALLSEESPLQKEGKFGKIQLLDNGETRLVIGDCFLRLTSPGVTSYSSDVVLVEDEGGEEDGGMVNLNSLGHIDQFVTAVPDLERFSKLGR